MRKEIELSVLPKEADDTALLRKRIASKLYLGLKSFQFRISRRSIDARKRPIKLQLRIAVFVEEDMPDLVPSHQYPDVRNADSAIVVGAGPAGLFAALRLIDRGIKPIVIERGKTVRDRRRDLAKLNREHEVNPDSNYCFGEGGAGTYSDGKLYTRSHKRGNIRDILETFVRHGAPEQILIDAHPHIGTNKLPKIIEEMRASILAAGGEVHFESRLIDIEVRQGQIVAVVLQGGRQLPCTNLILATGHSARDIFLLLHKKEILLEPKDFALGVRVEHPQSLIDRIQYRGDKCASLLPPAAYTLVNQSEYGAAYSFCMCPGGIIAPCATEPGEIVTNGWSPSKRNNPFANSGIVVSTSAKDWKKFADQGPLAGMRFQQEIEQNACQIAGGDQTAPAQRLVDYVGNRVSGALPECSYRPGTKSCDLREILPERIAKALQAGFEQFGRKMKGYLHENAIILATESRTSSPVRIPRDKQNLQHPQLLGLYPCGEGAGYAGGIVSAALDGQRVADALAAKLAKRT